MATDDRLLGIYLNDHLAGATAGLELAKRIAGAHKDEVYGDTLAELAAEIGEDRESLLEIMATVGVGEARYKTTAAWFAEKVGRLKLNGHLLDRSPLSSLVEIEVMQLGVEGKAAAWRTLLTHASYDDRLDAEQLGKLLERARRQSDLLEDLRPLMTTGAFAGDDSNR
jgi:hypothetical protein